jgi:hypothetical protein
MTCGGCHGSDGSGSAKGSAIAKLPQVIALPDAELVRIVREGVPGKSMPAMKQLGVEKIAAVVAYLRKLQGVSGAAVSSGSTPTHREETAVNGAPGVVAGSTSIHRDEAVMNGAPHVVVDVKQGDLNQNRVRPGHGGVCVAQSAGGRRAGCGWSHVDGGWFGGLRQ